MTLVVKSASKLENIGAEVLAQSPDWEIVSTGLGHPDHKCGELQRKSEQNAERSSGFIPLGNLIWGLTQSPSQFLVRKILNRLIRRCPAECSVTFIILRDEKKARAPHKTRDDREYCTLEAIIEIVISNTEWYALPEMVVIHRS